MAKVAGMEHLVKSRWPEMSNHEGGAVRGYGQNLLSSMWPLDGPDQSESTGSAIHLLPCYSDRMDPQNHLGWSSEHGRNHRGSMGSSPPHPSDPISPPGAETTRKPSQNQAKHVVGDVEALRLTRQRLQEQLQDPSSKTLRACFSHLERVLRQQMELDRAEQLRCLAISNFVHPLNV